MVTRPAPASTTVSHPADHTPLPFRERRSVYLAMLNEQLEIRAREYGHAYVTPHEAAWLEANELHQPRQTTHRFSRMETDRSDAALERTKSAT